MKKELQVFFEITDYCNLSCNFCCKTWRDYAHRSLTFEDLDKIISIEKTLGKISGGEPGVVKDKVFYYVDREKSSISMNTNLSLWTPDEIIHLMDKKVWISTNIPSLQRQIHHRVTNSNNQEFNSIVTNLQYLNPDTTVIVVVINKENEHCFKSDILNFSSEYGFYKFLVSPMISNGILSINKESIGHKLNDFYEEHQNLQFMTVGKIKDFPIPPSHKCNAGLSRFVILSNKDIVPCAWNKKHIIGNLDTDSIETVLENGRAYYDSYKGEEKSLCKGYLENL